METDTLKDRIARIETMDLDDLKAHWAQLFGTASPKCMSAKLMRRACLYQVQANALGGLKPEAVRALQQPRKQPKTSSSVTGFTLGACLMREWHGRTYVVEVVRDGFEHEGQTYGSLSALARHITGARWNGRRFFGVASTKTVNISA